MKLLRRFDYWLHRGERAKELTEEMEFHRAMAGEPIGNIAIAGEDARAVWIWPWLESVFQDLSYALRNLRRQPGFAFISILTLGIAVGLNTSFFTVFDVVVLRLWPVNDPGKLVKIVNRPPHGLSLAEYRYLAAHSKALSGVIAMSGEPVRLGFEEFGKKSWAVSVSGNYFQILGVHMAQGRGFVPDEDRLDTPENVAVLSDPLWRNHYGADPTIVGKKIQVDETPFTVVGVAAEEFTGTTGGREDLWIPLPAMQSLRPNDAGIREFLRNANDCCASVAGRIAPGYSRAQAKAELNVLSAEFRDQNKKEHAAIILADASILAGHSKAKNFMPVFALMFTALGLVLLLACTNVSNLLLARGAARRREIEIRRALGAGRARIVRQLLTEGVLLAVGSTLLGIAMAWKLPAYVLSFTDDPPRVRLTPDATVMWYAAAMAAITCIAFSLVPALHGTRNNAETRSLRLRNLLLAAQVAMSVVLLTGASLLIAGICHAREHDPGFRIREVSVISFELPASSYDTAKSTGQFYADLSSRLKELRTVDAIGITAREPLAHSHWALNFRLPSESRGASHNLEYHDVSPGYFDALGIPIVAGRNLQLGDDVRKAAVVNESMARRYFAGENPVGESIIIGQQAHEIVGVVRDAYLTSLDEVGPLMFQLFTGGQIPKLLVRGNSTGVSEAITGIVKDIDPHARVQATPLAFNLDQQLSGSRVMAGIAGMLGAFALALAAIGIFGVFAYVVEQRTREIGIRMALGAAPKQVIAPVLLGTGRAAGAGLGIGFIVAGGLAKLLAEYLYGVSPYEPRAYGAVGGILVVSGLIAAYLPAHRATHVDPLIALRVE